mmetsp:Transcript_31756/g.48709  ORF Transcript_31756/g.48709 Transcript_31756/m.48709 type:complete len:112 (+) Transcript_31756:85-420(+)
MRFLNSKFRMIRLELLTFFTCEELVLLSTLCRTFNQVLDPKRWKEVKKNKFLDYSNHLKFIAAVNFFKKGSSITTVKDAEAAFPFDITTLADFKYLINGHHFKLQIEKVLS